MSPHPEAGGSDYVAKTDVDAEPFLSGDRTLSKESLAPKTESEYETDIDDEAAANVPPTQKTTTDSGPHADEGSGASTTADPSSNKRAAHDKGRGDMHGGNNSAQQNDNEKLKKEVRRIIQDCEDFIDINDDVRMNSVTVGIVNQEAKELVAALTEVGVRLEEADIDDGLVYEIRKWKMTMKQFMAAALNRVYSISTPSPQPKPTQQPPSQHERPQRDASPSTIGLLESDLEYFMTKLRPNLMPDVAYGTHLSNTEIRELWDVTMPQIAKNVDECRSVLKSYVGNPNYRRELAREAQVCCQDATDWISDLTDRHREKKLHLDRNIKHREITFKPFKPGGGVSIYEFLSRFEAWAEDYLSEDAKADQLFNKYLHRSVTESYAELTPIRENFDEMKAWLIRKFGSVVPMAHGVLKVIAKLAVPMESQLTETVKYLRNVHKLLSNLVACEVSRGVPVPKLRIYLASNAFLTTLINVLPNYLTDKFFEDLVLQGTEDVDMIEGQEHLHALLDLIKTKYRLAELRAMKAESARGEVPSKSAERLKENKNVPPSSQSLTWSRWACPIKNHVGHDVNECAEFWNMTVQERRDSCKYAGCFTCLDRSGNCKSGCCKIQEVPPELICPDCLLSADSRRSPMCVLFCGLPHHEKPELCELTESFEAWIPGLDLQNLLTSVIVNLAFVENARASMTTKTDYMSTKTGCAVYNTTTGNPRPIGCNDTVVEQSEESAVYTMQTVRIDDEEVTILFDSGSNTHLIEGELAKRLKLDVTTSSGTSIKALGGKASWSEYGEYSLTLGPDANGLCHQLKMRGVQSIASSFPEVNLMELWPEVDAELKRPKILPEKIGGAKPGILIGINSVQLAPKLICTLPNGLGVYESALTDVYGSNICFGGPHPVFTKAYNRAKRFNPRQVIFTDIAPAPQSNTTRGQSAEESAHMSPNAANVKAEAKALEARLREEFAAALEKMREEMEDSYNQKLKLIEKKYQDSFIEASVDAVTHTAAGPTATRARLCKTAKLKVKEKTKHWQHGGSIAQINRLKAQSRSQLILHRSEGHSRQK